MANIAQHNNLLKCMVGGQAHFRHILTNDRISKMTMIEGRYPITRLPVCEHCERLAMWSGTNAQGEKIATCPHCGTRTVNPFTYAEYLLHGYDIDGTDRGAATEIEIAARRKIL